MRTSRSRTFRHLESIDSRNWTVSSSLRCSTTPPPPPPEASPRSWPPSAVAVLCQCRCLQLARHVECLPVCTQVPAEDGERCAGARRVGCPRLCGLHGRHFRAHPCAAASTNHQRVFMVSASRSYARVVSRPFGPCPTHCGGCRFIGTFGLVGAFITATAACGYLGLMSNRRTLLDLWYSKLAIALLAVEVRIAGKTCCAVLRPSTRLLTPGGPQMC